MTTNDEKEIFNGHYRNQTKRVDEYNYDIYPLLTEFSFLDYVSQALSDNVEGLDYNAVLIITDNQYILTQTEGYGRGPHRKTFANIMREITDGQPIYDDRDSIEYYTMCEYRFITARLNIMKTATGKFVATFYFELTNYNKTNKEITHAMFNSFMQFYNQYNDEIKLIKNKIPTFVVGYKYYKDGRAITVETNSLDSIKRLLEQQINYDKPNDPGIENIIGVKTNSNQYH